MKYGNDDQAGQSEIEARKLDQRRWVQLSLLPMFKLRAEARRIMAQNGAVVAGGFKGWARRDYVSYILATETTLRVRLAHHVAFGDGHERCPMMNDFPQCPEAIVSRETSGEQSV